jgi:L-lactate dehydrogenase
VIPIGSFQKEFGVTLSLPSIVGRGGVVEVLEPSLSEEERVGLQKSAELLKAAMERVQRS